jgi:alkylhydroperoxidase/carboxymuconolactone decarboxylase family protein YurZ
MTPPPERVLDFEKKHVEIWEAFKTLAGKCHETGGPLDEKSRRLVKLGIAVGHRHEGAVHSATRHALDAGISPDEIFHAGILAITTIGWPAAYAALTWINDVVTGHAHVSEPEPR